MAGSSNCSCILVKIPGEERHEKRVIDPWCPTDGNPTRFVPSKDCTCDKDGAGQFRTVDPWCPLHELADA